MVKKPIKLQTLNTTDCDPMEVIQALTNGGVEYAFESRDLEQTSKQAFRICALRF